MVSAIQSLALRAKLDSHDNGLCVVVEARSTDPLIGLVDQLNEYKLGGMKQIIPRPQGYALFICASEITHESSN